MENVCCLDESDNTSELRRKVRRYKKKNTPVSTHASSVLQKHGYEIPSFSTSKLLLGRIIEKRLL